MYIPKTLQNCSSYSAEIPTVCIEAGSNEWEFAYNNWIKGKNPTDSPEWKKGIFMTFKEQVN